MNSLKARLTLAAGVASVLVIGLSGWLLYSLMAADRLEDFDYDLVERARGQTALVEFDDDGLQFEWQHSEQVAEGKDVIPRYFQVRDLQGKLLSHSPGLPDADFPYRLPQAHNHANYSVTLPGGEPARATTLRFRPKEDDEAWEEPPPLLLIVAEPTKPMDDALSRIRFLIVLVGAASTLAAVGLLRLVLWRELKPLNQLAERIAAIDESSLGDQVAVRRAPAELMPVIAQLNALLARVDDTLRREQEFTAGAAHELRTPLAGIRGKLELALSRDRTPEQHREFARDCLDVALQMQSIVENLLTLARSGSASDRAEPVDVREALRAAWRPFAERAEQRNVQVDWEFAGDAAVTTRRETLHLIATNLLENAVNYVNEGGRIEVVVRGPGDAEPGGNGLRLEVANTGCTLTPEQAKHVFEPFWRADEARTGEQAHAGLGLAICRRLAKAAGGDVTVEVVKERFIATLRL